MMIDTFLFRIGLAGYLVSGALPFWLDSAQLVEPRMFGIRIFLTSAIHSLAFLGGRTDTIGFSLFNVSILISTPIILLSVFLMRTRRAAVKVAAIAIASQLLSAGAAFPLLAGTFVIKPGYWVWILALALMLTGAALNSLRPGRQP